MAGLAIGSALSSIGASSSGNLRGWLWADRVAGGLRRLRRAMRSGAFGVAGSAGLPVFLRRDIAIS
jgi:hypothetical protein